MSGTTVLEAVDLRFRFPHAPRPAVAGVSLRVDPGVLYAVIGPNGSGKSTLLRLLLGALAADSGEVRYAGRRLASWSRRALAREIGAVPQGEEVAFPVTVREMVEMGRYPHLGLLGRPGRGDRDAIDQAMSRCDVLQFADRAISSLSGGERQRVLIARALAQQPSTLVLDEPTVSLDIRHEMEIFELLAQLTSIDGKTVLLVTHQLNLAARYADRVLILDRGVPAAEGTPREVFTAETIQHVYDWSVLVGDHPGPGRDAGAPQVTPLAGDREFPSPDDQC